MFSTALDCRQSLSEVSLCFFHMVTRSWARLHSLGPSTFEDFNSAFKLVSEGFDKCEVIPDHQGPTLLKLVFC